LAVVTEGGGGAFHLKRTGMLVVSFWVFQIGFSLNKSTAGGFAVPFIRDIGPGKICRTRDILFGVSELVKKLHAAPKKQDLTF